MRYVILAGAAGIIGCASTASRQAGEASTIATTPTARAGATGPRVDHHQHLLSPATAALFTPNEPKVVQVPDEVAELLRRRETAWNNAAALAELYTEDAIVVEQGIIGGRKAAVDHIAGRFGRPYSILPFAYAEGAGSRSVGVMYTRGEGNDRTNVGVSLLTLARQPSGRWLISGETMKFPGPPLTRPLDADDLVQLLDQADIERAVVMSLAYFFERPLRPQHPALLRAENDWTAAEVARHPSRLVGFCSVNPLTDQALAEVERCSTQLRLTGLKLHFGNSDVDLKTPSHLERVKQVFAAANRLRLPVAAHLWDGANNYGRRDAELFLAEVLPLAPDIVVQIMHMAGGGPGWTDAALEVYANAVEARDPRTSNLYFDVATVADLQTHAQLELLAKRIRQIGPRRILYGSDGALLGGNTPNQEWGTFRGMVPLTDAEFAIIRDNVAPYMKQ
jgi:predicted TIM-barrel fold metal-dependent hydrolase